MRVNSRLPSWFKQELPDIKAAALAEYFKRSSLSTVCREALCPNQGSCYSSNTATFIILGDACTRNCSFCAVKKAGKAVLGLDEDEPQRLAEAVRRMRLNYVVITSVTRDDLADGGAEIFARAVREVRSLKKGIKIEVLIPDFKGDLLSLKKVAGSVPEVVGHNLETVERLYKEVRPQADYRRSLEVLKSLKELNPGLVTKSSLMLGLGEYQDEVAVAMRDLRKAGCDILVLGQYLCPSQRHYPVRDFIRPERFSFYEEAGYSLGFRKVLSHPKARSSFRAGDIYREIMRNA